MLKLENINVYYGGVHALKDVSLEVEKGSIITLLGANGAGKSTVLKAISRLVPIKNGEYRVNGSDMTRVSPYEVVKQQIIHCPENRRVFPELTVEENLLIGSYVRKDKLVKDDLAKILTYFPRLKERLSQYAGTLSGGEQQMLAMGRALMGKPGVLLLDEPSLGLAPAIVTEIFEIIKEINKEGIAVVLVEQNANLALQVADYAYVLENGKVRLEGPAKELQSNAEVRSLYLGA